MTLPKYMTTITPLSKVLALGLFVALPFVGFYLGYKYSKLTNVPEIKEVVVYKDRIVNKAAPARDLIEECGDIPMEIINIKKGWPTGGVGPVWSPNCRGLAWSMQIPNFEYGTERRLYPYEGVFVYDYFTKKSKKVYVPTKGDLFVRFDRWVDNEHIIFNNLDGSGIIELNIKTGETMPIRN